MTHKKMLKIIICAIVLLVIVAMFFMKYVVLLPALYSNNDTLDKNSNDEIKELLLNSIKYQHSAISHADVSEIYTESYQRQYNIHNNNAADKSFFIIVNRDFAQSISKINDTTYHAEIQLKFPDDWKYYYTIEKQKDNHFLISYYEIDP